jgi:hypothetical protein
MEARRTKFYPYVILEVFHAYWFTIFGKYTKMIKALNTHTVNINCILIGILPKHIIRGDVSNYSSNISIFELIFNKFL